MMRYTMKLQLKTERLTFRRYSNEDLPFVEALVKDPTVMRYIGNGEVKDDAYAQQLITRMQKQYENWDIYGLHVLEHNETGERIGHAGIVAQIIDNTFELELGYWIAKDYWGQGYGFEAASALKQYADEELELERYISAIQVGNEGSKRIAIKNGMHYLKTVEMDGKLVDIYINAR